MALLPLPPLPTHFKAPRSFSSISFTVKSYNLITNISFMIKPFLQTNTVFCCLYNRPCPRCSILHSKIPVKSTKTCVIKNRMIGAFEMDLLPAQLSTSSSLYREYFLYSRKSYFINYNFTC